MVDRVTPEVVKMCDSVCKMKDDKFGNVSLKCQRPAGHFSLRSPHEHAMGACEPMAMLVWGG